MGLKDDCDSQLGRWWGEFGSGFQKPPIHYHQRSSRESRKDCNSFSSLWLQGFTDCDSKSTRNDEVWTEEVKKGNGWERERAGAREREKSGSRRWNGMSQFLRLSVIQNTQDQQEKLKKWLYLFSKRFANIICYFFIFLFFYF